MSIDIHTRLDVAVEEAAILLGNYMKGEGATNREVNARLYSLLYAPIHGLVAEIKAEALREAGLRALGFMPAPTCDPGCIHPPFDEIQPWEQRLLDEES